MLNRLAHRPAARALAGTLLGNVPGFVLPFLITARVEAGRLTDAYFYAFAIALFASSIVSLALETNVLPVATHHLGLGASRFRSFARGLLVRSVAVTTAGYLVVAAVGAATVLVRDNWTEEEKVLCVEIIGIFGVYLAAISASAVLDGCLYAFGSFFATTVTVGMRSLLPLPALFLAPTASTALLLTAAFLAGGECARVVLLSRWLRRAVGGMAAPPTASPADAAAPPSVWSTALPYGAAMVLFGSNQLIDRAVAGSLKPGSVTVLDLAEKVFYAPVTILMSSVLLVSGARWAALANDRPAALSVDFRHTVRRAAVLSGAVAAGVVAAALVALAAVDTTIAGVDTRRFCAVLAILMVGFPAAVVTNAGVRLLTVLRRTRIFPALAIVSFTANVAGTIAGARLLGIAGIAASGTIWRTINLIGFLAVSAAALRRLSPAPTPLFTTREHAAVQPSITLES
ncbi:MAG TPA: lipid II flippase MurJ [Baekduia sp.]|nr:lipid II flippase MurJ [Baekduia sp.]